MPKTGSCGFQHYQMWHLQKWPNLDYFTMVFGIFEQFLAKPHLVARQNRTFSTFGWCMSKLKYFFLERSSAQIFLTWFDVLDMGVPAPEEMAGCEYIMSDLIGGKTWCEAEDTTGCFISIATKASEARLNNPWSLRLPNISLCKRKKADFLEKFFYVKLKCHK